MRAGDCMFLPAFHLHYVRSTGRNIAGMYMWYFRDTYEHEACEAAPPPGAAGAPLAEYDIINDFPGEADHVAYGRVKMGHPDWKRESRALLLAEVQQSATPDALRWRSLVRWARAFDYNLRASDVRRAWRAAGGAERPEAESTVPLSDVLADPQRAWERLFRQACVELDMGSATQEMDTRYEGGINAQRFNRGGIGDDDDEEEEKGKGGDEAGAAITSRDEL